MATMTKTATDLWFLNTWVTVRISESDGQDRVSILEHRAPFGDSPPLHIHHTEDEIFQVLEGEFLFVIGGQEHQLRAGEMILAPKGVPRNTSSSPNKAGAGQPQPFRVILNVLCI